jgi:type IV secretory pathway VirJ component
VRWDRKWTGPGLRLLPDHLLEAPWIVLDTPAPPAGCPSVPAASVPDIVPAMPTASRVRLPAGLSPEAAESAWKTQLPAALADLLQRFNKTEAARKAHLGQLADLPLTEVPATAPQGDALAIDLTGSGGYEGFDLAIGKALAAQGVPLVALSSLDYFWTDRDPDGAARDLARVLDHYLKAWHKKKAVLVGYSQGADILPFLVSRLPEDLRSRIGIVGLIGPDDTAEFDNGLSGDTVGRAQPPPLPVGPEIARLKGLKTVCLYGEEERRSLCPRLDPEIGVDLFAVAGGHLFKEQQAPLMIAHLLQAGGLPVRDLPPEKPPEAKPLEVKK